MTRKEWRMTYRSKAAIAGLAALVIFLIAFNIGL